MKLTIKLTMIAALATASSMLALAGQIVTVNFGTGVTGTQMAGPDAIVADDDEPILPIAGSEWVTSVLFPNIGVTQYEMAVDIPANATIIDADMGVMVDDSGEVIMNNTVLVNNIYSPQSNTYCAQSLPNCRTPLYFDLSHNFTTLQNLFVFIVSQDVYYTPTGLDVFGQVTYYIPDNPTVAATPEPGTGMTMALMGGLLSFIGMYKKVRV